jgi:phospholipase C
MNTSKIFPIECVIVLMLENRSHDHMLGYLPNGHGQACDELCCGPVLVCIIA